MSPSRLNHQSSRLNGHGALPDTVTTTIFISNLHCPSCVATIQESLGSLQPAPEFISNSIVSHSVVIRHKTSLAVDAISGSLEVAGFEVHSIFQDGRPVLNPVEARNSTAVDADWEYSLEHAVAKWTRASRLSQNSNRNLAEEMEKRQKHVEHCEQCRAESGGISLEEDHQDSLPLKPEPVVTQLEKASPYETNITESQLRAKDNAEKASIHGGNLSEGLSSTKDAFIVIDSVASRDLYKATLGITGMTCSSCVSSITRAVQQLPWVRSIDVNLLTNSGTVVFHGKDRVDEIVEAIEDAGFDVTVENLTAAPRLAFPEPVTQLQQSNRWKAIYAIGGMTCSSCVGNVTGALKKHTWIEKVDVNLVSNSATIVFLGKEHLSELQEMIEDAGYDATLDSIVAEDPSKEEVLERAISVRIDGMFCRHCPERITRQLTSRFGKDFTFEIEDPPLSQKFPILNIRYIPAPEFTIRHILQAIENLNVTFKPSIYHPPTIEDRAREMHLHERRRVLFRLVLSITVAIPTFLIGIVFMSLIDSKNPIRHYIMQPMWAGHVTRATWALFILATPVYFFAADTFHLRAIKEIKAMWRPGSRTPLLQRFYRFGSMNMLMSLGTSIAYFASVVELALAATKKAAGSMTDSYFDSVVFLTMFILIGRFLEAYSKAKTGDAVTSLGKLRPEEAILVDVENGDQLIATDLLEINDVVRVPHGTSPPFDGTIVEGNSTFDESSLTGESRPVKKTVGDTVFSGTINKGKPIKIRLTTISGTSMLDQIISVVREGQTRRAPVERVADSITSHFVPFVVLVAIVTWVTWLSLGVSGAIPRDWKTEASGGWPLWSLRFAIAVFVIACPCGIGLAAPTALFVGGGLAAKHGILVKGGGEAFQEASSLDCVVFDKTGTLTQGGAPAVTHHAFSGTIDHAVVLGLVKALEESSNHPIARALVSFCNTQTIQTPTVIDLDEVPGKGLTGTFKVADLEMSAIVGNEAFMADHKVVVTDAEVELLEACKARGESVGLIATSIAPTPPSDIPSTNSGTSSQSLAPADQTWELAAIFGIADPLRPEAIQVIKALKQRGIDVWMLSGDNPTTANAVGAQVSIPSSNIIAGVLPDQKAEKIKYLQRTLTKKPRRSIFRIPFLLERSNKPGTQKRATIAMVGDGINDAPALSTADLSIAIGSGSDIALSSSSFILITSHLSTLLTLLDLSRVVFRRVYFNFGWALIYNLIAMPVAAGVLYPITTGEPERMGGMHHNGVGMEGGMGMGESGVKHVRLDPVWASLAMALSSVSVVCSSLALRSSIPGLGFRVRRAVDMEG